MIIRVRHHNRLMSISVIDEFLVLMPLRSHAEKFLGVLTRDGLEDHPAEWPKH